jgi:prevent-host-death family protein
MNVEFGGVSTVTPERPPEHVDRLRTLLKVRLPWPHPSGFYRVATFLTWPYGYGYSRDMKSIAAGKFKDVCLKTLDEVASTKSTVVITKRGRPLAKLVPYTEPARHRGLAGSVLREVGDPFGTGQPWEADADAS